MTQLTSRSPRLPVAGVCLGLLASLAACGNGSDEGATDVSASTSASSSTTSTDPRATLTLRRACISTNADIVTANDAWNHAVDSHKADDLKKATTTMSTLASSLRTAGKDAKDASFSTKAEAVAKQIDALVKAPKPSKTLDTTTYNDDVDALTSYCSSVFPKPSSDASAGSESSDSASSSSGTSSEATSSSSPASESARSTGSVSSPASTTGGSPASGASASK